MLSYNVCHVLVTAVAHLHIVFVKNLVEFILFREVLLYEIEELLSDVSLDAFIKRWVIPDYLSFSVSILSVSGHAWVAI